MNGSAVCSVNITAEVQVFQLVISIPIFILGVLGNGAILVLFCHRRRDWSDMTVYLTNMAIADCTILITLPLRIYTYQNHWPFSVDTCLLLVSAYYVNTYVSIFTATAISVVRFVAVKFPFKAKDITSPRKALAVCVVIWIIICSLSATFHFVDVPKTNFTEFKCFQKITSKPLAVSFILVLEIVGFFLPFLIMAFCSFEIIRTLLKKSNVVSETRADRIQSIKIIAANMIVFVVCFSPVHFGFLLKFLVETFWPTNCELLTFAHRFVHIATCIANANCCLDSFSYYFIAKRNIRTVRACCISTQSTVREQIHLTLRAENA